MGGLASSTTVEIYMQDYNVLQYLGQRFGNASKSLGTICWWRLFFRYILRKLFPSHQQSSSNNQIYYSGKRNGELTFLDALLRWNNRKISVLVYRKPMHPDQCLYYSSHHQTICEESVVSSLCNRAYSITANKDDLYKENTRIKQVLKKKGF